MIIAHGRIYDNSEQERLLAGLEAEIEETRLCKKLCTDTVINAIASLSERIRAGEFDGIINSLEIDGAGRYKEFAISMLSRENLIFKLRTELGSEDYSRPSMAVPPHGLPSVEARAVPLGTLLHIAAGNADGLPAFSLAEGLLTGNINILKLPQADNGLTVEIIKALIEAEPALADYIYVFDTPSSDVTAIKKMADIADGIVVWGGDAAVTAVRKFAHSGTKLIEWGHRLSFAYISGYENKPSELMALAEHIITTKQLLCSSCQVIYIDTDSMDEVYEFCREFLPFLESAAESHIPTTIGGRAEITLKKLNDRIENILSGAENVSAGEFRGHGCGLTACTDMELELSYMFGNCLVKRLPQKDMMRVLRRKKGYLQTAGLICLKIDREKLAEALINCGVNRITTAGNMSAVFSGEAHDGAYPLRQYIRIANIE